MAKMNSSYFGDADAEMGRKQRLAEYVKDARGQYSQREFGRIIQVHPASIRDYEVGNQDPDRISSDYISKLAKYRGWTEGQLRAYLRGEKDESPRLTREAVLQAIYEYFTAEDLLEIVSQGMEYLKRKLADAPTLESVAQTNPNLCLLEAINQKRQESGLSSEMFESFLGLCGLSIETMDRLSDGEPVEDKHLPALATILNLQVNEVMALINNPDCSSAKQGNAATNPSTTPVKPKAKTKPRGENSTKKMAAV